MDMVAPDISFDGIPIIDEHGKKCKKNHTCVTVQDKIGEGGFGIVYKGTLVLKKPSRKTKEVAIKSITSTQLLENFKLFENFLREARIMRYE
jgi:hypothetical protein